MLRYLYVHDYTGDADLRDHSSWGILDDEARGNELCERLLEVIAMYTIADKYDVQPLRVSLYGIPHSLWYLWCPHDQPLDKFVLNMLRSNS